MNTKLLASIAVFVLLAAVVSVSMTNSAFAADAKKTDKKTPSPNASPKATDKTKTTGKKTPQPSPNASPKATDKTKTTGKKTPQPSPNVSPKATDKKPTPKDQATGQASKDVTVEMAKGAATNQKCADKCFVPSKVTVAVGGKVTWKNVDSAAHTATASDSSFDTSLVNAGASASNTFKTAGSFDYMCIVHPWMKGTVVVQ